MAALNWGLGHFGWKTKPASTRKRKHNCQVTDDDWNLAKLWAEKYCDPPQTAHRVLTHGYRLYLAELAKRMRQAERKPR